MGVLETVGEASLERVARLHFNWIEVDRGAERDDLDVLRSVSARARHLGLKLLLNFDVADGTSQQATSSFIDRVRGFTGLIDGVRVAGAHRWPQGQWREVIDAAPSFVWLADTLGVAEDTTEQILEAGFDFYLSSVKWWDTKDVWALAQYERFRLHARSIGFPENLTGDRLITELTRNGIADPKAIEGYYGLRYALAAFFGSGVIMPLGYEAAAAEALPAPGFGNQARVELDLRPTVTAINRIKAIYPCLAADLRQRRVPLNDALALIRMDSTGLPVSCFVSNAGSQGASLAIAEAAHRMGLDVGHLRDVTPRKLPSMIERAFWIGPRDWRVFISPNVVNGVAGAPYSKARARSQLDNARIIIEGVAPEIDAGRYPIKRVTGDRLEVAADIFRDGHEICAASLLLRSAKRSNWTAAPMQLHENDRWIGSVELTENCRHFYTIEAWRDPYASWLHATTAKYDAGQEISLELTEGRRLVAAAEKRASGRARRALADAAAPYDEPLAQQLDRLCGAEVQSYMARWGSRTDVTRYRRELEVIVDRPAARFGAWYEMFPRSQGKWADRSATFADCIARLDDIAAMGFSVVYLPPIHPIGRTNRKGRNNAIAAKPGDPGSPYAIGGVEGGHDAIAPELGTLADFRDFVEACRQRGMEVALDFAVQCSPDHPWITEHPEWFEFRPDGSIRFAENPPKKYQDIVNLDLRADGPSELWRALRDVVLFWVGQGVAIFRVDNPHTKPFAFWEWLIRDVQRERPDVIFLAEAFTRPKPLRCLAKLGFTQSYTYFTWRNSKQELVDYFSELTQTEAREYLRPQLFANTPDILSAFLQNGGPGAFRIRAVLAATLSSLFGIYNGFELCEAAALPESEEYSASEKYEYKAWDWDRSGNIKPYIAALNRARMQNVALQDWRNLAFLPCDSDFVIFFVKWSGKEGRHIFAAISLDPHGPQSSGIELPLSRLGIGDGEGISVANLLTGEKHDWMGPRQHVLLDPEAPAFLFTVTSSISPQG